MKKVNLKAPNHKENIKLRFRFLLVLFLSAFVLSVLFSIMTNNQIFFAKSSSAFSLFLVVWFFIDYNMLQQHKLYYQSLTLAFFFFVYVSFWQHYVLEDTIKILNVIIFAPVVLLLVQKPLRFIYKKLFNREPKVDQFGKFADLIYSILLLLGFSVLPQLLAQWLDR